jgi:hypothetical protein
MDLTESEQSDGRAQQLIAALMAEEEHIDCQAFLDVIATYVDFEVSGGDLGALEPGVTSHLFDCPPCAELYASLSQIARLEASGALPEVDDLLADLESGLMLPGVVASPEAPAPPTDSVDWSGRAARLAAAAAALAVVVAGAGWWQSARRQDHMSAMLSAAGEASTIEQVALPDGSWARLLYDPNGGRGLVHVGGIPAEHRGAAMQCWLRGRDGSRDHVGDLRLEGEREWMVLEGDRPLGDYAAFVLTADPDGAPLVEMPLAARR